MEADNRQSKIRAKGFNILEGERPLDYGSIKVGTKTLDDAVLNLGSIPRANKQFGNKFVILKAIAEHDLPLMRKISNYFYNTNGIYSRVCDYYSYLYKYDWYIVPEIFESTTEKLVEKCLKDFDSILNYLDNSHIKKICGEIAHETIVNGAYYGYIIPSSTGLILQQLPINYCRTIFSSGNIPAVEFNMSYFDECFRDMNYRLKILKMFPKEFQKGYALYKQGKLNNCTIENEDSILHNDYYNGRYGWYQLEVGSAVKFSLNKSEQPLFINAIPDLLDLDAAQDLDRKKQMQQLQKIVIQQLPLDKNGDLIFDVEEARDIHNNAVSMLGHSIGTDVLTTFATIKVEDIADTTAGSTTTDSLERMERAVYNSFGISRNLFNTESNLSLEKSIQDDESMMRSLLLQFHIFFDMITQKLGSNKKKYNFRFYMLETTTNNYKELAKTYKEQVQIGYSKMLPQIALGHSQSSIIHTAYFENDVLKLQEIMIPPLMSSTMNPEIIMGSTDGSSDQDSGRPEKPDDQKSEKTIQNKESM